jgi:hypothetical protein
VLLGNEENGDVGPIWTEVREWTILDPILRDDDLDESVALPLKLCDIRPSEVPYRLKVTESRVQRRLKPCASPINLGADDTLALSVGRDAGLATVATRVVSVSQKSYASACAACAACV